MTSVFVSYSSKNVKIAEEIENYLQISGYDVWRDKRSIEIDWSKEIADALSRQGLVLTLWSEDSSKS